MPLGEQSERANFFLRRLYFFYRDCRTFIVLWQISHAAGSDQKTASKGVTIDSGVRMPYFWDMQEHTYLRVHNSNFTGSPSSGILEL